MITDLLSLTPNRLLHGHNSKEATKQKMPPCKGEGLSKIWRNFEFLRYFGEFINTLFSSMLNINKKVKSSLFYDKIRTKIHNIFESFSNVHATWAQYFFYGGVLDSIRGAHFSAPPFPFYRPGAKKLGYFVTFSASKAPRKFFKHFFEIFGKFVNKNAIKSDF